MKILLTLTAAALASTAAIAQAPAPQPAPAMQSDMAAPAAPMAPAADPAMPMAGSAPTETASANMMTERDGKWYMGDRAATKAEIKAHKKSMKTPS